MDTNITPSSLEVKYAGLAIECGTLTLLLDAIVGQPVLVMPLARSVRQGSLTVHQWIIHVTARSGPTSPIYFASLRSAEVLQRAMGLTLTIPSVPNLMEQPMTLAARFHSQLHACVIDLLSQSPRVNRVVVPACYRLPDEWIWSGRSQEPRIQFRNGTWVLLPEAPSR